MSEETKKARFTPEQQAAISAAGRTIVSASAGSGKTTVMIEKIIRLILDGVEVSEILAVTFTKKAASQMKEKLRKAIIKAINEDDADSARRKRLKKQLDEVATADISTIHAFCSKLIRSNFYTLGIDNTFRVIGGDDAEGKALKSMALDELLDEGYEEKNENFMRLLSTYWRKKSDNNLRGILLTAYEALRVRADYREYLQNASYDEPTFDLVCDTLHRLLKEKCAYYLEMVEDEEAYFKGVEGKQQLLLCDDLKNALQEVLSTKDYFETRALPVPVYTRKSTSKKDPAEKKQHIERLACLKDKVAQIYKDELSTIRSREEELAAYLKSGETAVALAEYLLRFDDKYSALKTERNVLDYNDLEHKALALLQTEEAVKETREKYRFVFVDEYQDVNPVQEALLSKIGGDNLFLVGDVKQAIYGFRGSQSKFFVEKQKQFEVNGDNNLMMTSNFRSADAVLDAVNSQFSLAMTERNFGIDYFTTSYMKRGGRYALNDGRTQIHFLPEEEKAEKTERGVYSVKAKIGKREQEERAAAKLIRTIIEEERMRKWYDPDTGEERQVEYSDIAVLSRKKQGQIAKTVAALSAHGIPITTGTSVNVCDYAEVKTLIDILSFIDNAQQDIPLCSALLSSVGSLDLNELSNIRLAYPREKFFRNACQRYAEEGQDFTAHKLRKFYEYFKTLRVQATILSAGELLTTIVSETRMEGDLLAQENGDACLKRIHRFIEEANNPQPLCVHEFLARLRDLDYKIEFSENGGGNSVKVLTMHSSKGLEYPVVILDDLSALFRGADHDEVLLEEEFGIAPRAHDEEKMTKSSTLLRRLCGERELQRSIADELNLYYVALTRAKYALHMIFKGKSVLPDVKYARSFADFTDFSVWEKFVVQDHIFDLPKQERNALPFHPDETLAREVMTAFLWQYPAFGAENLPVKSSATKLLHGKTQVATEEEEDKLYEARQEGVTSIEAGTACHAFLEHFDFALLYDDAGARVDRSTLEERVGEVYDCFDREGVVENLHLLTKAKLADILSNEVFYRLQGCTLYKERQFLVALPVNDTLAKADESIHLSPTISGEEMIFQGAIDLLAVNEQGAWIIDYKYSVKDKNRLLEDYRPQLELYRLAVAKILKMPKESVRCTIVNVYHGFQADIQ